MTPNGRPTTSELYVNYDTEPTIYHGAIWRSPIDKVSFRSPLWRCEHQHTHPMEAVDCAEAERARADGGGWT